MEKQEKYQCFSVETSDLFKASLSIFLTFIDHKSRMA